MSDLQHLDDGTAFRDTGNVKSPPVVFIHGLGLNSGLWEPFVSNLADRYRLVSYDLYGHGQSKSFAQRVTLSTFSNQLLGVLDHLEIDKACIAGFSLGGMINRRFALDHPTRVSGLAILNSPHERNPDLQKQVEKQALEAAAGGPGATLEAALERWLTPEFVLGKPDRVEQIRNWVLSCDPAGYAAARRALAFGVTELIRPDPSLATPTLVMTCENDRGSTPEMSYAIAREIPDSLVMIVPGLRHLGLLEDPASFLQPLKQFLDRLDEQT